MRKRSPLEPFIEKNGLLILDGGLATELEKMGFDLNTHLWSAQLLDSDPDAIREVHLSYLEAGADCIATASYQASIPGFISKGYSKTKAIELIERSVELANDAVDQFRSESENSGNDRIEPIIAASIGPYGAYLANGAEYHGKYNVLKSELRSFHESRWEILSRTSVDLFACETIPSFEEAEVLLNILRQTPDLFAWISFSCKDGEHISDGTPIHECAELLKECDQVAAVGINCTKPKYIPSLINEIKQSSPNIPIAVYPNLGNIYDGETKTWLEDSTPLNCGIAASEWFKKGAKLIGGCCQIGPDHINAMKSKLTEKGFYRS